MTRSMPTWEQFMHHVLQSLSDGVLRGRSEICDAAARQAALNEDQVAQVLPSGESTYKNRIGWAVSFLTNVGALERPMRGRYRITAHGTELLGLFPHGMTERDIEALGQDPTSGITPYVATTRTRSPKSLGTADALDPTEQIQSSVERIHRQVSDDLLRRLHAQPPAFFEAAVVKLLVRMGYGGAEGNAKVTKASHDGGIDGIIDQDTLGLSRVYVQAKRYALDATIDRPAIQSFVGALDGHAGSGVFITTGSFTKGANEYASSRATRVVLIDGQRLARLMIQYGVGVQVRQTVTIVEVDEDFFE